MRNFGVVNRWPPPEKKRHPLCLLLGMSWDALMRRPGLDVICSPDGYRKEGPMEAGDSIAIMKREDTIHRGD